MAKTIVVLEGRLEQLEDGMYVVGGDAVDGYLNDLLECIVIVTITSND